MDPISAVGLVASIIQVLTTVGKLTKYVNDVKNGSEDRALLAREAASFMSFLTELRNDITQLDPSHPVLSGLGRITAKGGPLDEVSSAVDRLLRKLNKQEVDETFALIERFKASIGLLLAGNNVALVISSFLKQFGKDTGVAYVYFNYKDRAIQTAEKMVASLLGQLARASPTVGPDLVSMYKRYKDTRASPLLSELSGLLQLEVRRFLKTFIIIDALDEGSREDGALDGFIAEMSHLQHAAHLLITSRFSSSFDTDLTCDLRMGIQASEADVRLYLESRIRKQHRLRELLGDDSDLKTAVLDQITRNMDGMFLLAQLQIDFVARQTNKRDVRRSLNDLPRQLDDVYEMVLRRIEEQSRDDINLAERLLLWIVCAKRPLKLLEVQHALAIDPRDVSLNSEGIPGESVLIAVCAGLVTVDWQSSVVRLAHYTVHAVDVNARDFYFGETPLWRASDKGHDKVVREVLQRQDADVDAGDHYFGELPVERAAANGHHAIVDLLRSYQAASRLEFIMPS
ncbi:hypothetical protein B0H67DRAFT_642383 [Lasiosphaeris hirsuta]|uniref:Ankyrin repeat protein n=1 Tax=Lasiosphaeris hirsuta TaxID=260670 RepID=A0AA40B221_9PEZI|nr:hypothetical protein B0H67DRAFT_642383 [Lasiosphaeris hirsuta]